MITRKHFIPFISVLFFCTASFSQNANEKNNFSKAVDFLPPAPNAAAIAKAGFFNINKNTGAANFNIPLFKASGSKLSVDIGLTYASNGIKVDEIASRVGMGWSLNAGGAVTRTVRGFPDEGHTRVQPWFNIGNNWQSYRFCELLTKFSSNAQGYDSEPDLFSFNCNGISGSFILDSDHKPVLLPAGNYKIEVQFGTLVPWNFRITTTDGVEYYFGGGTGAVENTKQLSTCSRNYDEFIPNAWYLKKIKHPTGEEILFTYLPIEYSNDISINESISQLGFPLYGGNCRPVEDIQNDPASPDDASLKCKITQQTQGVLLRSISIPSYWSITFEYSTRPDGNDKLVQEIIFKNAIENTSILKDFWLEYSYVGYKPEYSNELSANTQIPYLVGVNESISQQAYKFGYISPEKRPSRLSFSQDHWGFFNGKHNSTLLPPPPESDYLDQIRPLPNANADREPEFNYTLMGMLNKIVYPTGGIQEIQYEPNTVAVPNEDNGTLHEYTCSVAGTGLDYTNESTKEFEFETNKIQTVKINSTALCPSCTAENSLHYKGSIEVVRIDGLNIYPREYFLGGKEVTLRNLPSGRYKVIIMARTDGNSTTATINYYPSLLAGQGFKNKIVGGLRVKSVLTGNKTELPTLKRYYYGSLENPDISSSTNYFQPTYGHGYTNRKFYRDVITTVLNQEAIAVNYYYCYRKCYGLYSNSLLNLYSYSGSVVSYQSVIESDGDNFELGATQTKFLSGHDELSSVAWGQQMINAPQSNYSIFQNGKVDEQIVFKKIGTTLKKIKSTKNNYLLDQRATQSLVVTMLRQNYANPDMIMPDTTPTPMTTIPTLEELMESFSFMHYSIIAPWSYVDQTVETNYDENGENPITSITHYYYDDAEHKQLSRIETTDSKGDLLTVSNKYPYDYPSNATYTGMTNKHIIATPISVKSQKKYQGFSAAFDISEVKSNYASQIGINYSNTYYDINSIETSVKGNPLQIEGTITKRDERGNVLEYTGKDGIVNAVLWGYKSLYPVVKAVGISYAALTNLIPGVDIGESTSSQVEEIANNLRNNLPPLVMITSYTYNPQIGISSITDPNGKKTTYNYDAAGRLSEIWGSDGKLVKKIEYSYAGAEIYNEFGVYFNTEQVVSVRCTQCASGTAGSYVNYTIPANVCFSAISEADANEKARTMMAQDAQRYADLKGRCSNADNICSGDRFRKVGCNCEMAIIECLGLDPNYTGQKVGLLKRYKWSDGFTGPVFSVESETNDCAPQNN